MSDFLYHLIIYPIELLMEFVFSVVYQLTDNPGVAVISVSLAFTLLSLPLYKKADELQEKQKNQERALAEWKNRIQKTFHGDERFLILSEYYRQNGYKPWYALRGSLSLLLQIPFFIAAYHYLSHCDLLKGQSFLLLRDLGQPDGLLRLGGITIHIMPFLMTVINLLSVLVFSGGTQDGHRDTISGKRSLWEYGKDNGQFYFLAGLFLILLYSSPSGLVLYWTMNQVFSLMKSVTRRMRHASVIGKMEGKTKTADPTLFMLSSLIMFITVGVLIPSSVLASAPVDFIDLADFVHPLVYLGGAAVISAGAFIFWPFVLWVMENTSTKRFMTYIMSIGAVLFLFDSMLFGRHLGIMSPDLIYDNIPQYSGKMIIVNGVACLMISTVIVLLVRKKPMILRLTETAVLLSILLMSGFSIRSVYKEVKQVVETTQKNDVPEKLWTLSRTGKNVIVIMLDRAISGFVPYIFAEEPALYRQFDGFTWYPNTISYGKYTDIGSTALFGGYEYTPLGIAARPEETLAQKHDEALKVIPKIFSDAGFRTTMINPPYAGWNWIPDLSVFSDINDCRSYYVKGAIKSDLDEPLDKESKDLKTRSFFCHGLFRSCPLLIQNLLYDGGNYHSTSEIYDIRGFLDSYGVMENLTELTEITEENCNTFFAMDNDITHDPVFLSVPDYKPAIHRSLVEDGSLTTQIRESEKGKRLILADDNQNNVLKHYACNVAPMRLLGDWFDWLRAEGVYDNTRIILVSDHGRNFSLFPEVSVIDISGVNPLLMFKDFDHTGWSQDNTFMTNADVPTLCVNGLVADPINPFTGNPLTNTEKNLHEQVININDHGGLDDRTYFQFQAGELWTVRDDIFVESNWRQLSSEEEDDYR